jgi:hypothetical protein
MDALRNTSVAACGMVILGLGISETAQAASFLSTSGGAVGTVETNGSFSPFIGTGEPEFSDIAVSEDGIFFGSTFDSLYRINQSQGSSSLIDDFGVPTINALGITDNNVLYGAGNSNFYQIDSSSGEAFLVANIPDFRSSGDIAFDSANDQFFATSNDGAIESLFSINLTGKASEIGDIGYENIFGLSIEDGSLVGYRGGVFGNDRIIIDPTTGEGTFDTEVVGVKSEVYGAAYSSTGELATLSSTSVPEPATMLGTGTALGLGVLFKKKHSKKQNGHLTGRK